jgi:hypothetical protein
MTIPNAIKVHHDDLEAKRTPRVNDIADNGGKKEPAAKTSRVTTECNSCQRPALLNDFASSPAALKANSRTSPAPVSMSQRFPFRSRA